MKSLKLASNDLLIKFIDKAYPFPRTQRVGNCAWESLETALYASLLLERLGSKFEENNSQQDRNILSKTNEVFGTLRAFIQVNTLENYIHSFEQEKRERAESGSGKQLEATEIKKAVDISTLDQNILWNVLKESWRVGTWDKELGAKMEKMEAEFVANLTPYWRMAYRMSEVYQKNQVLNKFGELKNMS